MKNFVVALFFMAILSPLVIAQNNSDTLSTEYFVLELNQYTNASTVRQFKKVNVTGTYYYKQDWQPGKVKFRGKWTGEVLIKLDMLDNQVEVFSNGQNIIVPGYTVEEILLEGQEKELFRTGYASEEDVNLKRSDFVKVIFESDDFSIVRRNSVKLLSNTATYATATQQDYFDWSTYYYVVKDSDATRIKLKEKDILNLLGNKDLEKKVKEYAKSNKLSFKDEEDIPKILEFAGSI